MAQRVTSERGSHRLWCVYVRVHCIEVANLVVGYMNVGMYNPYTSDKPAVRTVNTEYVFYF